MTFPAGIPSSYVGVRIGPSNNARDLMEAQGIDLNDAINVARYPETTWPDLKYPERLHCQRQTLGGRSLEVVMSPVDAAGRATIIAVFEHS